MFRNQYLCRNQHNPHGAIVETHAWEAFGDRGTITNCPKCGSPCTPIASDWAEKNERYFALTGYGCGPVMSAGDADPLKTLDDDQVDTLVHLLLYGDIGEVPLDGHLMGCHAMRLGDCFHSEEEETRLQAAAAVVYLSGRVAADVPFLCRTTEREPLPYGKHEKVHPGTKMPLPAAMQQAREQLRAFVDDLPDDYDGFQALWDLVHRALGGNNPAVMDLLASAPPTPQFYECGSCGMYHPAGWDGDCRDDDHRFSAEQLDEKYGSGGWEEGLDVALAEAEE